MHKLFQSVSAREQLIAALEASAGALRALEAVSASLPQDTGEQRRQKEHLDEAAGHLRTAISEIRASNEEESLPGAAGFVMAVRRRRRQHRAGRPRPRG